MRISGTLEISVDNGFWALRTPRTGLETGTERGSPESNGSMRVFSVGSKAQARNVDLVTA